MSCCFLSNCAQATEFRLGVHYEPLLSLFVNEYATAPNEHSPLTTYSIDISATTTPEHGPKLRSTLGLGAMAGYPMLRLDVDFLSRGTWYYGAGVGTGLYKDSHPLAPSLPQTLGLMLNAHGAWSGPTLGLYNWKVLCAWGWCMAVG